MQYDPEEGTKSDLKRKAIVGDPLCMSRLDFKICHPVVRDVSCVIFLIIVAIVKASRETVAVGSSIWQVLINQVLQILPHSSEKDIYYKFAKLRVHRIFIEKTSKSGPVELNRLRTITEN